MERVVILLVLLTKGICRRFKDVRSYAYSDFPITIEKETNWFIIFYLSIWYSVYLIMNASGFNSLLNIWILFLRIILFLWIYYLNNKLSSVSSLPGYNVSQNSVHRPLNGPYMAVDDDHDSCAVTEKGVNGYWRIQFNQTLTVKGMILRLKGGMFLLLLCIWTWVKSY